MPVTALLSSAGVASDPSASIARRAYAAAVGTGRSDTVLVCTRGDGTACGLLRHLGLSSPWATAVTTYGEPLLRVVLVLVVAASLRSLLRRAIYQLSERIAADGAGSGSGRPPGRRHGLARWRARGRGGAPRPPAAPDPAGGGTVAWERRAQRARTVGSVLGSLSTGVLTVVAVLLVLGEFGIDLAPLLAGAGVIGVAVGFGAQTLVKDFLSGLFLIAEDQFGVGDSIELDSGTNGTVEAVGLRTTRLRALDGTVWYIRNGDVMRVGNRSQGWARAVVDVDVAAREDVAAVERLLAEAGAAVWAEPAWREQLLEEPAVWGIEALTAEKVVLRLAARTTPLHQWAVARELRRRIKDRFDDAGVGRPDQPSAATAGAPAAVPAPRTGSQVVPT